MKTVLLLVPAVLLSACAASSDPESLATGETMIEATAASCDGTHPEFIQLKGATVDYPNQAAIGSSTICVTPLDGSSSPICGTTAANGRVTLSVKACQDVRVSYHTFGRPPASSLVRLPAADQFLGMYMLTRSQLETLATKVGTTYDPSKAVSIVTSFDPQTLGPMGGVSVSYPSGTQYYLDAQGVPSTTATATSGRGIMGFVNAEPGVGEAVATMPGRTCSPILSIPGSTPGSALVDATAGGVSATMVTCR